MGAEAADSAQIDSKKKMHTKKGERRGKREDGSINQERREIYNMNEKKEGRATD